MKFELPESLNYIAVFLTFDCNLNCSYCINDPDQTGTRKTVFKKRTSLKTELTPEEWIRALKRLPVREDLPITFQGGEPLLYGKGKGLGKILAGIPNYADLLTNFAIPNFAFTPKRFRRKSPYPSVRVSFHQHDMNDLWGDGLAELVIRCETLAKRGLTVSPESGKSNVGIYIVDHPQNHIPDEALRKARERVPVFFKDFLGICDGKLYGRYAYPLSSDLISTHKYYKTLSCECRTTELLLDPLGFVWNCHHYLCQSWRGVRPIMLFKEMENFNFSRLKERFYQKGTMFPIGHILDPDFTIREIETFRQCYYYGCCLGCDTKLKRDRFATENVYRSSVIIRNIDWPKELLPEVSNDYKGYFR
ncbi:MAG: radical SAM protein [Parcubacteria group bacterium]